MKCQQNCDKLKKIIKIRFNYFFSEIELKKTLGSAWKTRVGRVSWNKQLFLRLRHVPVKWQSYMNKGWYKANYE